VADHVPDPEFRFPRDLAHALLSTSVQSPVIATRDGTGTLSVPRAFAT
jgi:hypothetical protein